MKIRALFLLLLLQGSLFAGILDEHLPKTDKRYATFAFVLKLLVEKNAHTLVETGTARYGKRNFIGDGGSTYIFAEWASKYQGVLYSVDIDGNALRRAANDLHASHRSCVHFIHANSIDFLKTFDQQIDFLYLDSFDFDLRNPRPSQEHHLKEIIAAYPKLKESSIVMIDDCGLPHGGKGKLVIAYLLERGWKVLLEGYQVILVKN